MTPARRRQNLSVLLIILSILLLFAAFFGAIFLSWEAPAPLQRIEKILPASALEGAPNPGAQTEIIPVVVAPLAVPVDGSQIEPVDTGVSAETRSLQDDLSGGTGGPIIIDGTQ